MSRLEQQIQSPIFIKMGNDKIDVSRKTIVMGIINVTPDSFSDGGVYNEGDKTVQHAIQLVQDGADLLDIGGESTRPGARPVSLEEELDRVIPAIRKIRQVIDVPISVDTYKAEVARQALNAGADVINDIWGLRRDPEMANVVKEYNVPIILMHNREKPIYDNLLDDIVSDLMISITIARNAGISDEQIILDPGIGFGKTYEQNLTVMRHLEVITQMGFPVLLGTSRKSVIGLTLDLPPAERVEGTGATVCLGIMKGCHMVRVHDVLPIVRMTKMLDAILKGVDKGG